MVNKTKKGFTIVELVIVIAVIAILAAVLIPTFSNLINKANESADTMLVKNLNTALSVDAEKHTTMSAALEAALVNGGYDVATITTKNKDTKILWDSKNDLFVYLKGTEVKYIPESTKTAGFEKAKDWELFEICKTMPTGEDLTNQKYSIYLLDAEYAEPVVVTGIGFDAGENTKIPSVKFTSDKVQTVIINTNGCAVEVDAANSSVAHYGDATVVTIKNVATSSYHENGTVGEIKLAAGRVVVENKAEVGSVLVTADAVTTGADGKKNVSVEVATTAKLGGVAANKDTVARELTNVVSGTTEVINTVIDNTGFAGGFGTEASPYLIATVEHFQNIESGKYSAKKYYKVVENIEFTEDDEQTGAKYGWDTYHGPKVSYIILDGQGHTIKVGSNATLFDDLNGSTISNFIVTDIQFSLIGYAEDVIINKVDTYGNITWSDGNHGVYVIYAYSTVTLNDCDNYATINSSGDATAYNAVYVGYAFPGPWRREMNFTYCDNYGSLTSGAASMFVANLAGGATYFNIDNCNNYGTVRATYLGYTPNCFCSASVDNARSINVNGTAVDLYTSFSTGFYHGPNDTIVLTKNEDNTLTFTKSSNTSVAYYVVSVGLYVDTVDSEGNKTGTNRVYATERIDANGADSYTSVLKALSFVDATWVANNSTATIGSLAENTTYTLDGTTYYLVTGEGNTVNGVIKPCGMISVSAYDANGNLISSASFSN